MTILAVRAALETALAAMSPALALAYENMPYAPVPGTPFAYVNLLPARPFNPEFGGLQIEQGYMRVRLAYPLDTGPAAASTRAELIRTTFARGTSLAASGVIVTIPETPEIEPGRVEDDRYVIPVNVRFTAQIQRS